MRFADLPVHYRLAIDVAPALPPERVSPMIQAVVGAISCFAGVILSERLAEEGDGAMLGNLFGLSSSFFIPLCAFSILRVRQISPSFFKGGFRGSLAAIALSKVVWQERRFMPAVIRCASAMYCSIWGVALAIICSHSTIHRQHNL